MIRGRLLCSQSRLMLHVAVDADTGEIAAHLLTNGHSNDAAQVPDLLRQPEGVIGTHWIRLRITRPGKCGKPKSLRVQSQSPVVVLEIIRPGLSKSSHGNIVRLPHEWPPAVSTPD